MTRDLIVRSLNRRTPHGIAQIGPLTMRCGLGRSGMTHMKREGDGATPIGRWQVLRLLFRPDRRQGFFGSSILRGAEQLRPNDGWCDAVGDRNYNRTVRLPYPASAETMWRQDALYDLVVILGHNQKPRVQGGGSAIFMHLAREIGDGCTMSEPAARSENRKDGQIAPTAGCVSLRRRELAIVLSYLRPGATVRVIG